MARRHPKWLAPLSAQTLLAEAGKAGSHVEVIVDLIAGLAGKTIIDLTDPTADQEADDWDDGADDRPQWVNSCGLECFDLPHGLEVAPVRSGDGKAMDLGAERGTAVHDVDCPSGPSGQRGQSSFLGPPGWGE